jgi:hypothetical protein
LALEKLATVAGAGEDVAGEEESDEEVKMHGGWVDRCKAID